MRKPPFMGYHKSQRKNRGRIRSRFADEVCCWGSTAAAEDVADVARRARCGGRTTPAWFVMGFHGKDQKISHHPTSISMDSDGYTWIWNDLDIRLISSSISIISLDKRHFQTSLFRCHLFQRPKRSKRWPKHAALAMDRDLSVSERPLPHIKSRWGK